MRQGSVDVRVPDLGDVGEVVVVEWLKAESDRVEAGEDLVEVESEKTAFVVPAPAAGTVRARTAHVGDRLEVGGLLGRIDAD
jgi:pyruvate/2-oxoglutarate dehydrogenase complex dihydrolipoamide acyltransferase (E2) component